MPSFFLAVFSPEICQYTVGDVVFWILSCRFSESSISVACEYSRWALGGVEKGLM